MSKRKKIYDGNEARELFQALYFSTEPGTSDSDHAEESEQQVQEQPKGLCLRLSSSSDNSGSDSDDTGLDLGQGSSPKSQSNVTGVGLEGFSENSYTPKKNSHPRRDKHKNEAKLETDGQHLRDCSFTEVDLSLSESDCYISEVCETPEATDIDGTHERDQDYRQDVGVAVSEVDLNSEGIYSETDTLIQEDETHIGVISEVDVQNTAGSDSETDALIQEDETHIGVISEVDVQNTTGSDIEMDTVSEERDRGVSFVDDAEGLRGRKHTRVHFVDGSSDSSCTSIPSLSVKRRKKNKTSQELSSILRMRCCRNYCLHKVSRKDVSFSRTAFQGKSKYEQRQWILKYFIENHEESGSIFKIRFSIGVTEVCQRGWRLALGISRTRLWQINSHFQDGLNAYLPPNQHRRGMQSRAVASSMMWLDRFSRRFGDKLPDQDKVHLPSCLTRASVYQAMKEELEDLGEEVCCKEHFHRMWRKEMSHVTIPKVNRFSKCDVCTQLKQSMEKTNDKEARKALQQQREDHLTQQKTERTKYYKHAQKARQHPDKYISIIIDGMDQQSTSIPKFYRTSKSVSSAWRLPSHVTGTIVHGRGQHMFVDNKDYPHDSNLTANILLQVLNKYANSLPDTLYLQMDNCGRENKNQCLLGLCALLVELNVFKKIKLCFLMKGHTHEDIDQLFSRISLHTSRHNIPTLSSLLHHIPLSYNKPNTTAERIHIIYNIRDWLDTHMNKPSHHSLPHQFKITKVQGHAVIHTKKWSSSPFWTATTGASHILREHPSGLPRVVSRRIDELHLDRLQRDMGKYRPYLTDSEHQEWMQLLHSFGAEDDGSLQTWILLDILMSKDAIAADEQNVINSDIFLSNDEQDPIPPVNLGRKTSQKKPLVPDIGQMMCVFLEEYHNEWPQVGQITALHEDSATLHWYTGTTTSSWTELNTPIGGLIGGSEPYISTVLKSSFITGSFTLTPQGKLPQDIQRQLREKREELYS